MADTFDFDNTVGQSPVISTGGNSNKDKEANAPSIPPVPSMPSLPSTPSATRIDLNTVDTSSNVGFERHRRDASSDKAPVIKKVASPTEKEDVKKPPIAPSVQDKPPVAGKEEPIAQEKPPVQEKPQDKPQVQEKPPVVQEKPVQEKPPVVQEKPVMEKSTVAQEKPADVPDKTPAPVRPVGSSSSSSAPANKRVSVGSSGNRSNSNSSSSSSNSSSSKPANVQPSRGNSDRGTTRPNVSAPVVEVAPKDKVNEHALSSLSSKEQATNRTNLLLEVSSMVADAFRIMQQPVDPDKQRMIDAIEAMESTPLSPEAQKTVDILKKQVIQESPLDDLIKRLKETTNKL